MDIEMVWRFAKSVDFVIYNLILPFSKSLPNCRLGIVD